MRNDMDSLLQEALKPGLIPSDSLNQSILENRGKAECFTKKSSLTGVIKAAAIVLCLFCIGGPVAYAATNFIKNILITEHAISIGNPAYVDDAAIAAPEEDVSVDALGGMKGGPGDKWTYKRVEKVNGSATNTYYNYLSLQDALEDAELPNWLTKEYELDGEAIYCFSDTGDVWYRSVGAFLSYEEGTVRYYVSQVTGNVASDMAHSIKLENTENKREYKDFVLVDEVREEGITTTYVIISDGDVFGYLSFRGVSEEGIKAFLDTVIIPKADKNVSAEEEIYICEGEHFTDSV